MGLDLSDRVSSYAVFEDGKATLGKVETTAPALKKLFKTMPLKLIVIEVGTHSRWVSRVLKELGQNVREGEGWMPIPIANCTNTYCKLCPDDAWIPDTGGPNSESQRSPNCCFGCNRRRVGLCECRLHGRLCLA